MGLISFLKNAGEKLLHAGPAKENEEKQALDQSTEESIRPKEQALERAILDYIAVQNLPAESLTVAYDAASATVTVSGSIPDQQTREKIILCCGNVQGVAHVNDQISVIVAEAQESQFYTVKSGDTLSRIAKDFYGDANKYMAIFTANKPMLEHPDKIYPGQMLRIPPQL